MTKYFLIILPFLINHTTLAQEQVSAEFWKKMVNWDGVTHWSNYMVYSSGMMGPNAMPPPLMLNGKITPHNIFKIGSQVHFSDGDNTQNPTLYFNYNFQNKVSVGFYIVPIEFYRMSFDKKVERKVYYKFWDSTMSVGDLYVNTEIQLFTEDKSFFDVALRIGLKTASSSNKNPARFSDSPGYYFDVFAGKNILPYGSEFQIRPYLQIGFYAWQTNSGNLPQNDAAMYGLGVEIRKSKLSFNYEWTGYHGYMDNGDSPLVMRGRFEYLLSQVSIGFNSQLGFRDYNYISQELTIGYLF